MARETILLMCLRSGFLKVYKIYDSQACYFQFNLFKLSRTIQCACLLPKVHIFPPNQAQYRFLDHVIFLCSSNLYTLDHLPSYKLRIRAFCRQHIHLHTSYRLAKCRFPSRACYFQSTHLCILSHQARCKLQGLLFCFQTKIHHIYCRHSNYTLLFRASFHFSIRPCRLSHQSSFPHPSHVKDHLSMYLHIERR